MLRALVRAARPHQWVKNLFVLAPLVFAKALLDEPKLVRAIAAVAIFCLISSGVYLWNDVVDVEKDRAHPVKRSRPIASGELPIAVARAAAASFAAIGLALAWLLQPMVAAEGALYLALNFAYSIWLKHVPYVDVLVISSGYLLRVAAGADAVQVYASKWLFLCTGLVACFLGFGKRAHELATAGEDGYKQRRALEHYRADHLKAALYLTGAASVAAYFFYTLAEHTRVFFQTDRMVWTVPAIAVGVSRFLTLSSSPSKADSPTEEMLRDPLFLASLAAWAAAVVAIIYLGR